MSELDGLLAGHPGRAAMWGGVLRCAVSVGGLLDHERVAATTALLHAVTDSSPVRAVLLFGEGPSFCAGVRADAARLGDALFLAVSRVPVPVVCAVHGWAVGAGIGILLAADVVVGGPATKFRPIDPGTRQAPSRAVCWALPRAVGAIRARDLLLTDGIVSGAEAERFGLVTRLVPDHRIGAEARLVAEELAAAEGALVATTKRLVWESAGFPLSDHDGGPDAAQPAASMRNWLP